MAIWGSNDKQSESTVLIESSNNSVTVEEITGGYNLAVSEQILNAINNKQDIINVAGVQSTAIYSMSFAVGYSGFRASEGEYIPLIYIEDRNLGKSQFEFEVFSREDSALYYARYIFASFGDNYRFVMLEYVDDEINNRGYFNKQSVVCVPIGHRNYLICKRVEENQGYDFFFCNILMQDALFCFSTKFYSRGTQPYYINNDYQSFVQITESISEYNGVNLSENAVPAKDVLAPIYNEIGDINTVLENIIGE